MKTSLTRSLLGAAVMATALSAAQAQTNDRPAPAGTDRSAAASDKAAPKLAQERKATTNLAPRAVNESTRSKPQVLPAARSAPADKDEAGCYGKDSKASDA